jgi:hypothetical protein
MVAAAEQDFCEFRDRVTTAIEGSRLLLMEGVPELEIFMDVYWMLTRHCDHR